MIFIDSNIPMYLIGGDHPHRHAARRRLESAIAAGVPLVTSAEVYQEVLHRYIAIERRDAIEPAFSLLESLADEVFPIERDDVARAAVLLHRAPNLSARDAIHVAVMLRYGVRQILSFDRGFDAVEAIERLE